MADTKSVGDRLRSAKTLSAREEIARDWMTQWQAEQMTLIRGMEKNLQRSDIPMTGKTLGQLKVMSEKRFQGLASVIKRLADPDIDVE